MIFLIMLHRFLLLWKLTLIVFVKYYVLIGQVCFNDSYSHNSIALILICNTLLGCFTGLAQNHLKST